MRNFLPVFFGIILLGVLAVPAQAQTPAVSGTLSVSLTGDANSNGQVNPSDQLSYTAVITNTGSGTASGVNLNLPAPANTTLAPGSLKTSLLARPDAYTTLITGALSASSVLNNDFGLPSKTVTAFGPSASPASVVANGSNSTTTEQGGSVVMNTDGTFTYTPTGNFVGYDRFGYTAATATPPSDAATVTIGVGTPITALANTYTVTGNVTNTQSATATGLLGNDTGDQPVVTAINGSTANVGVAVTTAQSGTVTVAANGTFVYNPPAGYTGTDSFTYTANNGLNIASSATVTLTIQDMIWFVQNGAPAGGTGTLARPFNSLNAFQAVNNGSGNNPAAGDNIFVYSGTYSSTTAPLILLNNQKLIGQGATAPLANIAGITPAPGSAALPSTSGAAPVLTNSASSVVQLGQNNLLRGVAIGTSSVVSLTGIGFGTLNVSETSISNTASALGLNGGTVSGSFSSITSTGGVFNIQLTDVGGNLAINGGSLSGASSNGIRVAAGTVSLTYAGNMTYSVNANMIDISSHSSGTLIFSGTLNATNGNGLNFDNADGTYNFTGTTTLSGSGPSITFSNGTTGTFTFGNNTSVTQTSGTAFNYISGSANIVYNGTITTSTGVNALPVRIQNHGGGTITFQTGSITSTSQGIVVLFCSGGTINFNSPTKSLNTGANNAVDLSQSNSGSTINFGGGGLAITTSTGTGFLATGGGTVNVTGAGNTITSGNGTALNVANTTIGASGLTFRSISANGGANGIVLNNTGTSGGLTVTGDGGNSSNGSGGTIQNTAGADGSVAGNGIYLTNTRRVSLNYMRLSNHQNNGVFGAGVTSLTINRTRFTGNNGTSNSGQFNESVVQLVNTGGDLAFKNSYFAGGAFNTIRIENIQGTSPVISSLLADTDTLTLMQGSQQDVRSTALLVNLTDGSLTTGTIQNCRIDQWWGNAIHVLCQGTSSGTVTIQNNYCENTNQALAGAGGIWVAGGTLDYTIANNTVLKTNGTAISADRSNFGGLMRGSITGNTIGASGVANSGSAAGSAIFASHHGNQTTTTTIRNNTIRQINGTSAISVQMGDDVGFGNNGGGFFNATIQDNNIQESGTTPLNARFAILVTVGATSGDPQNPLDDDKGVGCFNIFGNIITNFNVTQDPVTQNRIRVNQRFKTTAMFPGYTGANNDNAALSTYLLSRNTASNATNANSGTGGMSGPGFTNTPNGAPCSQ
ncbi:beta strand repeat-containing protein [Spirosoma fluminis]